MAAIAIVLAAPIGCRRTEGRVAIVSGKTVFGAAALEGASIEVQVWADGEWTHHSRVESGYHGDFRLELAAGRYRLLARATLPGQDGRHVEGAYPQLLVEGGQRLHRLVIPLKEGRGG